MSTRLIIPARSVLRGVSQILFIEHAVSGVLILLGLTLVDARFAALVLLGSAIQSATGWAAGRREDVRHGLMGYNGALVGAAAGLHTGYTVLSVLLTVMGAAACVGVHALLERSFSSRPLRRFSLPVATAPFCIVADVIFGIVGQVADPPALTTAAGLPAAVALGLGNSFSEVLLADGLWCGALILAALAVASPTAAAFGLGGAAAATVITVLIRDTEQASTGLHGYSAVLVAIAFGSLLWTDRSLRIRTLGALAGVVLALVIQPVLSPLPVPVFTWPFLLAMWWLLVLTHLLFPHRRPVTARSPEGTAVEPGDRR